MEEIVIGLSHLISDLCRDCQIQKDRQINLYVPYLNFVTKFN